MLRTEGSDPTERVLQQARSIVAEAQGAWVLTNAIHEAAVLAARNLMTRPRGLSSEDIPLDLLRDAALECIDEAPVMGTVPYSSALMLDAARSLGQRTGLRDLASARSLLASLLRSSETCETTALGQETLTDPDMTAAGRSFSVQFLDQVHEVRILFEATPSAWDTLQRKLTDDMTRLMSLHPALDNARKQGASRRTVAAARDELNSLLTEDFQSLQKRVPIQRDLSESDLIDLDSQIQEFLGEDPFLGLY
jgi:hypothetical protein